MFDGARAPASAPSFHQVPLCRRRSPAEFPAKKQGRNNEDPEINPGNYQFRKKFARLLKYATLNSHIY